MLGRLIRFVIISRFSKSILIFLVIIAFYVVLFNRIENNQTETLALYYGPSVTAFALALPSLSGGIAVLKSDRDYLFTLPVKRRDLSISLFIVQFLSFGLIIFYTFVYMEGYLKTILLPATLVAVSIVLSSTSLGPVTYTLKFRWRFLIAVILALWSLSAIFGFPYTPSSVFIDYAIPSSLTAIALAVILTPLAFRALMRVDLDLMKTMSFSTSKEVKKIRSFANLSPLRAIFSEHFNMIEVSGRINMMGGGSSYRSGRFRTRNGVFVMIGLSVLYFILVYHFISRQLMEIILYPLSVYTVIPVMFASMGVLANERLWLGFISTGLTKYLKLAISARTLSFIVLLAPIAAANFLLAYLGYPGTLEYAVSLLVIFPSLLIIVIYMSAFVSPFQIKEEMVMPGQYNLKQMAQALPILLGIIVMVVAMARGEAIRNPMTLTIFLVIVNAIMFLPALILLASEKVARKTVESLVRNGFV